MRHAAHVVRHGDLAILALLAGVLTLGACSDTVAPVPSLSDGPSLGDIVAAPGAAPDNVLATMIDFTVSAADSVRISFMASGGRAETTPYRPARSGADTVWLLGLEPVTTYSYQIDAMRAGTKTSSPVKSFSTAPLPAELADVGMTRVSGSTSAYILAGVRPGGNTTGGYAVAFDSTGAIAWYHDFVNTGLNVSNVVQQPNGNITAFVGNSSGSQAVEGYYVEITPEGKEIRTYKAPSGYYTDDHELLLTGDGADLKAHFITYSIRTVDLTSIGGKPSVQLAGHQIVRENSAGQIEFVWDAWDRLTLDEWVGDDGVKQTSSATDFDHPNAVFIDKNGNYVVSWRNLNQVMNIDSKTGQILSRIGGVNGNYTIVDDPLDHFTKQHSVKILANGNMLLYDNGTEHSPAESRAAEYVLDPIAKTATFMWGYRHDPAIFTPFVGWVQRYSNGNTLVAFANNGRVVEVNPSDQVLWEAQLTVNGSPGSSYRFVPIRSLYGFSPP